LQCNAADDRSTERVRAAEPVVNAICWAATALSVRPPPAIRTEILERSASGSGHLKMRELAMTSTHSKFASLFAAALLIFVAVPACSKADRAQKAPPPSSASASSAQVTDETPTTTTAAGKPETVVFEVTGTGSALTIDLVPSGPDRLYDVPLPWSSTVTITPDVTQLQVVVVGKGEGSPGCRITLDGTVVAEKPEGGDAHCVFDR
jgi:hypothetical protein